MAESFSETRSFLEGIRDERGIYRNTATRIGTAMLKLLEQIVSGDQPFLRKDRDDWTNYLIRFLDGAIVGNNKIKLNADGSITCERINVKGSAIFNELVFNHQNVLEGDTFFTDKGIIETVQFLGGGQYKLTMRKLYDNDRVTFHAYDVLRCAINNLDRGKTFRTSWMLVNSVDQAANTMTVTLYDNEDVPGGVNYSPAATGKVVRWGNAIDETRQQTWFISSVDGRILFLQGVNQPIVHDYNYAAFLGLPPDLDFLKNQDINYNHPYLYARGLIAKDFITLDYYGNPQYTPRDRGFWQSTVQYIRGWDEDAQGYYVDRVWWGGCLWQAAVDKPTVGKEPRFNNADWVCLLGGDNMAIEITSTNGDFFPAGKPWTTTLVAEVWNAEMKIDAVEIDPNWITWQRISDDVAGDVAWNIQHATGTVGLRLDIDSTIDVPGPWQSGSQIAFQIDITLPKKEQSFSARYSILM